MYLILYYLKNPIVNHNIIRNWQDRYLCDLVSSSNQIIDRSKLSATKKNYKKKTTTKEQQQPKKKKQQKIPKTKQTKRRQTQITIHRKIGYFLYLTYQRILTIIKNFKRSDSII